MTIPIARQHLCQLYDQDAVLVDAMAGFLAPGIGRREAVIVIATPDHIAALDRRLAATGGLLSARASGRYLTLDAEATLAAFMVGGAPDRSRFIEAVGAPVADALRRHGSVRAFGEMVSLLWQRGETDAAIALEELWNELMGTHPVALLCGYAARPGSDYASVVRLHAGIVRGDATA
jgi:hypothetical protein